MKRLGNQIDALTLPVYKKRGLAEAKIMTQWPLIVGPALATSTLPTKLVFPPQKKSEGVLHVLVESAFALELQYREPQILEQISIFFGYRAVARLALKQGPVPHEEVVVKTAKPLDARGRTLLENLTEPVEDEELKTVLTSLGEAVLVKNSSLDKSR